MHASVAPNCKLCVYIYISAIHTHTVYIFYQPTLPRRPAVLELGYWKAATAAAASTTSSATLFKGWP